jgi:uncharacterized protein YegJ (DUF2314 family)
MVESTKRARHGRRVRTRVLEPQCPHFGHLTREGQLVKLILANSRERGVTEPIWVLVTRIDGRAVTGMLDNSPSDPEGVGVRYGDEVSFDRGRIVSVWGGPCDDEPVEEA